MTKPHQHAERIAAATQRLLGDDHPAGAALQRCWESLLSLAILGDEATREVASTALAEAAEMVTGAEELAETMTAENESLATVERWARQRCEL